MPSPRARETLPLATMTQTGSAALTVIAWVALAVAGASALAITFDIVVRGRRQPMAIMNWVWPITALYWGPVALFFYRRDECLMPPDGDEPSTLRAFSQRNWWPISKGVCHCGAGCTLGDIIGEWIVYLTAWSIPIFGAEAANTLMAAFVADFVLAWSFGIVFQYFAIVPMRRDIGRLEGIWLAIKADTLSIVSFQIGLFAFMALYHLVLFQPPLSVASSGYWFMMQIGMVVGFFTAWPVNAWLILRGWKERM